MLGVLSMTAVIFGLGRIAIINSERRDAEKERGDALQASINALQARTDQNRAFFELVRELLIAQGEDQKKALLDQLRGFQFSEPTTTTTTTTPGQAPRSTPTTARPNSSPTTAPRAPPSTTTTTAPPAPPPSPPPTTPAPCVSTPVINICPPGRSNERNQP